MEKVICLTFDIEECDFFRKGIDFDRLGFDGTCLLIRDLDVSATFFVTKWFVCNYPIIVKAASVAGFEIASHGNHLLDFKDLSVLQAERELLVCRGLLEEVINKRVVGFRAPRFCRPYVESIRRADFLYDSSVHPVWMPGRYNGLLEDITVHKEGGVVVVPISVGFPQCSFSSFFFKLLPLWYSKLMTLVAPSPVVLYFHPWEFLEVSDKNVKFVFRWGNKGLRGKLLRYIEWCKRKGFLFKTVNEAIKE